MPKQVAIITGAGGGIGRAIAVELGRLGYLAMLVGRTEMTLRETERAVPGSAVFPADVTKPQQVEKLVNDVLSRYGRVDVLINNAGIAPVLSLEETSHQNWHDVIDTNLSAAYYFCRAVWPTFKKLGGGVVVNISSMAARDPFPGFLAYGAAKAGLNNLGISLAREGAQIGVNVYTVAPGAVETPMLRKILSPEQFPSDNTLDPAEVARVVGQCVQRDPSHASGDVIWLTK